MREDFFSRPKFHGENVKNFFLCEKKQQEKEKLLRTILFRTKTNLYMNFCIH